jgi:D-arabinose 1-dehydrogenase-like Zn-dependent alcohol dehydrogenase
VTEGRLKVTIDSVIDLDDVNQAFDRLGERSVKGKLVLNLST